MRKLVIILLALALGLSACSTARQKLSPRANVNAKTAGVYYAQQNVEKAEEFYRKVLEAHPDHALSLRRIADISLYKGENFPAKTVEFNTEAFQYYTKALEIYDGYDDLTNEEKLDIRDMTRRRDGAWTRIYRAGDEAATAGNTQEAMEIFELAHDLNPDRFEPMIRLKDIYQKELKDDAKAEEILLSLIEKEPDNQDYILEIGAFYFNVKNFAEAAKYFEQARENAPADTDNLMNLSYSYYELENYSKALEVTQAALELQPADLDILLNARDIAYRSDNKELTVSYLKKLLDIRSNELEYAQLCLLLNELEQYEELISYAQQWYQWDNENEDAVQFVILAAAKTDNKPLQETFTRILQSMRE
ncbi:MAG: tetratricopeptide repeat protein [Candidatus Cloacimonetes bacterium]|jgi:tetratricopeptide (TPR) repeat protein|nr:tetratricopeptide repeat protein [Candidatus Cloacimonadota bacterium]MDY0299505.1 tetratricopeptide repeat protein [Candidatus Cloacimonadaceae bacterium]MCB5279355.1 tetratricopeptide repeat protein [Candidatus Cloacimonadota bacterium]MCK9332452.1 tetratricopeptide repeat protein [Candidatus Cloacimonadota bacterium]MDD2210691.1 tetratricopeptide repeat protein [Candidatus Cloacimonadota bacterium]